MEDTYVNHTTLEEKIRVDEFGGRGAGCDVGPGGVGEELE